MDTYVQLPTEKGPCFVSLGEIAAIHPYGAYTFVFIKGQPKPITINENTQAVFAMMKEADHESYRE